MERALLGSQESEGWAYHHSLEETERARRHRQTHIRHRA